jgi:hypothetical protein
MPRLCGLHLGVCLTTEEKAWKIFNHGSPKSASWHDEDTYFYVI